MERETEAYKLSAVSKVQYRVLANAGGYQRKAMCLTRELADGRLEIVMTHGDVARIERCEAEVNAQEVFEELMAQPLSTTTDIVPPPVTSDGIPECDKLAWERSYPDKVPEHETGKDRPRDGGGLIDLGGLFNR
jgi:hypothetical protein